MILHIARVIFILLEVLILFNLLIVVHELGHFLAARWRGLYIEKFGVWLNPRTMSPANSPAAAAGLLGSTFSMIGVSAG